MEDLFQILNDTCFVAGTPLLTPEGSKAIEEFQPGDLILSRSEHDPHAPIVTRRVERVFKLTGLVAELRVGGRVIETTAEHPFYVQDQGWKKTCELEPGDQLVGHHGTLTPVEEITLTERTSAVYNLRVADDHTYFVGDASWGFSVWAHNTYSAKRMPDGTWGVWDDVRKKYVSGSDDKIIGFADPTEAKRKAAIWNTTEGHHADPKFLGGDPDQDLTEMLRGHHRGPGDSLHNELNRFLDTQRDAFGRSMRPKRGNKSQRIIDSFGRSRILRALAEFYKRFGDKYPDVARDFFKQHPEL